MMNEISPKFNATDALLLYSVAYRQHHGEIRTLGGILLTTDAINRSFPMANELEDGFSRLIIGGFIELQGEQFTATKNGVQLFNDVTNPQTPKLNVFEQIRLLTDRLNKSSLQLVEKQLTITNDDVSKAVQEADVLFAVVSKKADEIIKARKTKESS
jgi:hypothetical protein